MAAWLFSASLCSIYWLFCKLNFGSFLFCNIHALCSMCLIFSPFISLNVLVGRHDATGPRYLWETTLTQQFGSLLLAFLAAYLCAQMRRVDSFLMLFRLPKCASIGLESYWRTKNEKGHTHPCGRGIGGRLGQPGNTRKHKNHQKPPGTTKNHWKQPGVIGIGNH